MTQEEKDLLLKDLCARLLYGVKCRISDDNEFPQDKTIDEELTPGGYKAFADTMNCSAVSPFFVKPYLRPMSSMTDEEDEWLNDRINFSRDDEVDRVRQKWGIVIQEIYTNSSKYVFSNFTEILDWLNEHHFDYRGLIEKGLALEAPEDMYK